MIGKTLKKEDHKIVKWRKWIDTIHKDIGDLLLKKRIFLELVAIVKANPLVTRKPHDFLNWMKTCFVSALVMGIRRQAEISAHKPVVSLAQLIDDIKNHRHLLTRARYISLYEGSSYRADLADRDFTRFAGEGNNILPEAVVFGDLEEIENLSHKIVTFADKRVAHSDKGEFNNQGTYQELYDCLDHLNRLREKYMLLITADNLPTYDQALYPGWKDIFRVPWINS